MPLIAVLTSGDQFLISFLQINTPPETSEKRPRFFLSLECTCCSHLQNLRPDGLVPGLFQVPYLYLVYRINGQYQVRTGTYLVGTPEIRLCTIFNAGGWELDFYHRLIVSPFLKGQGPTDSLHPLCLFAHRIIGPKDAPLIWINEGCLSHLFSVRSGINCTFPFK